MIQFDAHQRIGWDMDGTLNHGPNAARFRTYIAAHSEKRHHVITFRDRDWAGLVGLELYRLGLDPRLIASVEFCPEPLHDMFMLSRIPNSGVPKYVVDRARHGLFRWKGRRARELGCTILVDDEPDWVVSGCQENGVSFLDAAAVLEPPRS